MEPKQIEALLERYHNGEASTDEIALLESWYLSQGKKLPSYDGQIDYDAKKQELWQAINKNRSHSKPKIYILLPRVAAAASIILALGLGWYFLAKQKPKKEEFPIASNNDIAPGSSMAILTLSDGRKVKLDGHSKGTIATQGNTAVTKGAEGLVSYKANGNGSTATFNTITTPKGGEYQVMLPDGTHVWLNAASSLKYPVAFNGQERKVELTGEAYFEVARNKAKPFRVTSAGQTVEVLGTHFNVNAYPDEADITTTLLEGAVKVSKANRGALLKPGQQAIAGENITVEEADTDLAVAWKNGKTYFKNADIPTMMRSLSRWYNVDVVYSGEIPLRTFTGGIPRKSNLSTLLKILNEMNIHARIEGRKIIVTP